MSFDWFKVTIFFWWLFVIIQNWRYSGRYTEQARTSGHSLPFLELTMFQFLIGGVAGSVWLKFVLKRPVYPGNLNHRIVCLIVLAHVLVALATNATYYLGTWHSEEVVRNFDAVMVLLLLKIFGYREIYDLTSLEKVGMVAMATGSCVFVRWGNIFTYWGISISLSAMLGFSLRNIFIKSFGDSWKDPLQKYTVISVCGFFLLSILVLGKFVYSWKIALTNPKLAFERTAFHLAEGISSISVLECVSPLSHAVLATTIRLSAAMVTSVYVHGQLFWRMLVGISMFTLGLLLFYRKTEIFRKYEIKRTLFSFLLMFGIIVNSGHFLGLTPKSSPYERTHRLTSVRTFWVYDHPLPDDILLNIKTFQSEMSETKIHVFCATFHCVEKIESVRNSNITASFFTFNDISRDSPLESWFSRHPLHKLLSGKYFEDHLHEAVRLALLWRHGGVILDPFVRIHKGTFRQLELPYSWVATASVDQSSQNILHACTFPPQHPFIRVLAHSFLTLYLEATYDKDSSEKLLLNFQESSAKELLEFCEKANQHCPQNLDINYRKIITKDEKRHFGVVFDDSTFDRSSEIENFATTQFLPFVDNFFGNNHLKLKTNNSNVTIFLKRQSELEIIRPFLGNVDPIVLSLSMNFQKKPNEQFVDYLRRRAPVGCADSETMKYLRNRNIEAYYSDRISILAGSPVLSKRTRTGIYLVDVNTEIGKQLPLEIQRKGILLNHEKPEVLTLNRRKWLTETYVQLEKYATARLIITQNIDCALAGAAMNTPVLFISSPRLTRIKPWFRNETSEIFHIMDAKDLARNDTLKFFRDFLAGQVKNPNQAILMRLRATAWNAIRRHESLREAALRFGVVPFSQPDTESLNNTTFHLIFTTSNRSVVKLLHGQRIKGAFSWRYWRSVESVFHHHPFARVMIHSNTLTQSTFDVLSEAGYNIQVKPYSLVNLTRGTPAEPFVSNKLADAMKGPHWYVHESDLVRLLVVFRWGGIYIDTDSIVVRNLEDIPRNSLAKEHGGLQNAYINFERGHAFLNDCLHDFYEHYSKGWADNGPVVFNRVLERKWSRSDIVVLSVEGFCMFNWRYIEKQCFDETSGPTYDLNLKTLRNQAYIVHTSSKITGVHGTIKKTKEGTLCSIVLNSFCVLCNRSI